MICLPTLYENEKIYIDLHILKLDCFHSTKALSLGKTITFELIGAIVYQDRFLRLTFFDQTE